MLFYLYKAFSGKQCKILRNSGIKFFINIIEMFTITIDFNVSTHKMNYIKGKRVNLMLLKFIINVGIKITILCGYITFAYNLYTKSENIYYIPEYRLLFSFYVLQLITVNATVIMSKVKFYGKFMLIYYGPTSRIPRICYK